MLSVFVHLVEVNSHQMFGYKHSSKFILQCSTEESHICKITRV